MRGAFALALLLGACTGGGGGAATTAGGEARDGASCDTADERRVTETEVCTCGPQHFCGGVQRDPEDLERMARTLVWDCHPRLPAACDDARPHQACTDEGLECPRFNCCGDVVVCEDGEWVQRPGDCPA